MLNALITYPEAMLIQALELHSIIATGLKRIDKAVGKIFRDPMFKYPNGVPKDFRKLPLELVLHHRFF